MYKLETSIFIFFIILYIYLTIIDLIKEKYKYNKLVISNYINIISTVVSSLLVYFLYKKTYKSEYENLNIITEPVNF